MPALHLPSFCSAYPIFTSPRFAIAFYRRKITNVAYSKVNAIRTRFAQTLRDPDSASAIPGSWGTEKPARISTNAPSRMDTAVYTPRAPTPWAPGNAHATRAFRAPAWGPTVAKMSTSARRTTGDVTHSPPALTTWGPDSVNAPMAIPATEWGKTAAATT